MLEVRCNTKTGKITGWWTNRFGNYDVKLKHRPDEAIMMLEIPLPTKPMEALVYDVATQTLIDNPDYVEPTLTNLVFTTLTDATRSDKRLKHIEDFLKKAYPE